MPDPATADTATDDDTDTTADDDASSAADDGPAYHFDGFKIEFSDKVQLMPPAEKQAKGTA